jgi:tetratricopeptide (TPR) repeat protein
MKFKSLILFSLFLVISCSHHNTEKNQESLTPEDQSQMQAKVDEAQEGAGLSAEEIAKLEKDLEVAKVAGAEKLAQFADGLYLKASDASHSGNVASAVIYFEKLVLIKPEDEFIKRKYVVELIKIGEIEQAIEVVSEVYQISRKTDDTAGLLYAGLLSALNKHEQAISTYKDIMKDHPKSEDACLYLCKTQIDLKNIVEAKKEVDLCQKKFSKNPVFPYYKGKIALKENQENKAMEYFRQSLKIDPDYYQASIGIGLVYENQEKFDKAEAIYRDYLSLDPNNFTILSRYVQILFNQEKFEEVVPFAENLLNLDPSNINLKVKLGILYSDIGKMEEAKNIFKEILVEAPGSDKILFYLGSLYQKNDESEEAIEYYSKIDEASSLYLESHIQIASILKALAVKEFKDRGDGSTQKRFIDYVDKSVNVHSEHQLNFVVTKSGFFEEVGDFGQAISMLDERKESKDFTEDHHYYMASLMEKNGEVEKARDVIRKVLLANPNNAHALNFLGYSMVEVGDDLEQGFKLIKKAVELKPDDGYIRDSLGWYYYKVGKLQEALRELKLAVKLEGKDLTITKHLAIVYQDLKSYSLAKKVYEEALKLCKEEKDIQEVGQALEKLQDILRLPASKE